MDRHDIDNNTPPAQFGTSDLSGKNVSKHAYMYMYVHQAWI
jgi:hypothetical protein